MLRLAVVDPCFPPGATGPAVAKGWGAHVAPPPALAASARPEAGASELPPQDDRYAKARGTDAGGSTRGRWAGIDTVLPTAGRKGGIVSPIEETGALLQRRPHHPFSFEKPTRPNLSFGCGCTLPPSR